MLPAKIKHIFYYTEKIWREYLLTGGQPLLSLTPGFYIADIDNIKSKVQPVSSRINSYIESVISYSIFQIEKNPGEKNYFTFCKMGSLIIIGNLSGIIFDMDRYPVILNNFAEEIIRCDTHMSLTEKEKIAERAEKR